MVTIIIRFALVGLFLWSLASFSQAEAAAPLVTLGKDGRAFASAEAPELVKKAVEAGNKLVGLPYKYGGGHGKFEDNGYDCSGAASYLLREIGAVKGVRSSGGFFRIWRKGQGELSHRLGAEGTRLCHGRGTTFRYPRANRKRWSPLERKEARQTEV